MSNHKSSRNVFPIEVLKNSTLYYLVSNNVKGCEVNPIPCRIFMQYSVLGVCAFLPAEVKSCFQHLLEWTAPRKKGIKLEWNPAFQHLQDWTAPRKAASPRSRSGFREPHQRKPFTYWLQPRADLHTIIQSANQKLRCKSPTSGNSQPTCLSSSV